MPRDDVTTTYTAEKNKQENQPVYLYSIFNFDGLGSNRHYAGYDTDLIVGSTTYQKSDITHESISQSSGGAVSSVQVNIPNINREMELILRQYNGLRDRKVSIKHGFANQLDPANWIEEIYWVDHAETGENVAVLELSSRFNVLDVQFPRRMYTRDLFPGIPTRRVFLP